MNIYHLIVYLFFIPALALTEGCGKDPEPNLVPAPLTVAVNTDIRYQTIAGFGGANRMWGTEFLKPAEAKLAFGTGVNELGLSIFRVRIASDPAEWPNILESVQAAQQYGVKILASPWSPPAHLKNNNSDIGGYLLPDNYEAFKDHLNAFVSFMAQNGVDIYAVSIQNEPDIQVSYESCDWSSNQMIAFLKDYGHLIQNTRVTAPESFRFDQSYTNALINDNASANNIDIVGGHIYGGGLGTFPNAEAKGKEIWMTEYLLNLNTGNAGAAPWTSYSESRKWDESLEMLQTIHMAMTSNWNAYIWWYLQRYYSFIGDGTQGTANGQVLKRGYAFSQFAKFVRPGSVRVEISTNKPNDLAVTAYESTSDIVAVIINPADTPVKNLHIDVPALSGATAFKTSLNADREEIAATITDGKAVVDLDAKSITTVILQK